MATAFFGLAKQKAPIESSGSVPHVGLAGSRGRGTPTDPGRAHLSAYGGELRYLVAARSARTFRELSHQSCASYIAVG